MLAAKTKLTIRDLKLKPRLSARNRNKRKEAERTDQDVMQTEKR